MEKKAVIVIPSLNPDNKICDVVSELSDIGLSDIIVVDDGSKAECKPIFEALQTNFNCVVLHHAVNCGKGRALKTAFNYYLTHYNPDEYVGVITADADGQHLPTDIKKCADYMTENNEAFVLGVRNFKSPEVPFKSKYGNWITSFVFKLLFVKSVCDTQTGLRGIPNSFLYDCITFPGERFEYEINMLIRSVKDKLLLKEIIIETVYFDGNRETHFRPLKDSLKIYGV